MAATVFTLRHEVLVRRPVVQRELQHQQVVLRADVLNGKLGFRTRELRLLPVECVPLPLNNFTPID